MGYGVVRVKGSQLKAIQYGVLKLGKYDDPYVKLRKIFEKIGGLIEEFGPDFVALEAPIYGKNVQSMLKLGRAQGVAMAAALSKDIPVAEYLPKVVKRAVTGNGNASKEQVAGMLSKLLSLPPEDNLLLDATDALAVALCHHFQADAPKGTGSKGGWSSFLKENPGRQKG